MIFFRPDSSKPFQLTKFVSIGAFLLILTATLFLSVIITNYARNVIIKKNNEAAELLAQAVTQQLGTKFITPTIFIFKEINLNNDRVFFELNRVMKEALADSVLANSVLNLKLYGLNSKSVYELGKEAKDFKNQTALPLGNSYIQDALASNKPNFRMDMGHYGWTSLFKFKFPPKSAILIISYPVNWKLSPRDEKESLLGVIEISQDITSDYASILKFQRLIIFTIILVLGLLFLLLVILIKRSEKMLMLKLAEKEKLEYELNQTEKLATMGKMVASIAHEIRNPLGIISSIAELLLKKAPENDSRRTMLQAIYDEAQRLARTVADFLDYAKPTEMSKKSITISDLVNQIGSFLSSEFAKKNIKFSVEIAQGITITGDSNYLYRAIYNIIINSMQAITNSEGWIKVSAVKEKDLVYLYIIDSGEGLKIANANKYLEPFFTTKQDGTGLGLSIVASILKNHNAEMKMENVQDNSGCITTITFFSN